MENKIEILDENKLEINNVKVIQKSGFWHKLNLTLSVLVFLLLAAPLLLIFFIKMPDMGQELLIFDISYHQIIFIFFLIILLIGYIGIISLKLGFKINAVAFFIFLFCCSPIIIGLENNFNFKQIILDIPFFINWPFYLKPAYLLIEFILPLTAILYLILLIKSFFNNKPLKLIFLLSVLSICIGIFIGLSALTQTEQQNIFSLLLKDNLIDHTIQKPIDLTIKNYPIKPQNKEVQNKEVLAVAGDKLSLEDLNNKVTALTEKINRITEALDKVEKALSVINQSVGNQKKNEQENQNQPSPDKHNL